MKSKSFKSILFLVIVFAILLSACGNPASSPSSANLFVVVGNNASRFTGNGSDGLLLDQFAKENKVSLYVQVVNDREIKDLKAQMLSGQAGSPDILIADDSLLTDGLQSIKYLASHKVGIAIRKDVADNLGLQGNTISYANFAQYLKAKQLMVAASNALAGSDSAEFFFSTMAWCSNTDASNLTADIIQKDYVRACGKEIYDFLKSTNGSNEALNLVFNTAESGDKNGYNSVITFDSALLGKNGLNAKLNGNNFFKFYYFQEATAKTDVTLGTKNFSDDQNKKDLSALLTTFLLNDASQQAINLAGFTEGSSALVNHDDSAFKQEWGVSSNPAGVQVVNPPIASVAESAKRIYRDLYKRAKEINLIIDLSGSIQGQDIPVTFPAGFKVGDAKKYCGLNEVTAQQLIDNGQIQPEREYSYVVTRLQAITCAIETFSDPVWLEANDVMLGPSDVINYWLFSTQVTTDPIAQSIGQFTGVTANNVINMIGPAHSGQNFDQISTNLSGYVDPSGVTFTPFQGTWMFDATRHVNDKVAASFDPNKDYYFVILTDGENNNDANTNANEYFQYWKDLQKPSFVLMGIQFGGDGNSIKSEFTQQFGGNTFVGTNNADLVKAFKVILGN